MVEQKRRGSDPAHDDGHAAPQREQDSLLEEDREAAQFLMQELGRYRQVPPEVRERAWQTVRTRIDARAARQPQLGWWGHVRHAGTIALAAASLSLLLLLGGLSPVHWLALGGLSASPLYGVQWITWLSRQQPDRVVFVSTQDGNPEIYVMNRDGSAMLRLTDNPAIDDDPALSPDGTRVAFRSLRDGNSEVYVVNVDGSGLHRLTDHPAADYDPAWTPDGRQIIFRSNRGGDDALYVTNLDGSGARRISSSVETPTGSAAPSWS